MVIGICGYKGSGKSAAAKYIAEAHKFKRINFKDALVIEMKERLPNTLASIAEVYGYKGNDELFFFKPTIMRALMQEYGTEVRREDNQNYWVDKWKQSAEFAGNIVADDVRFTNELDAVKELGGIIIRIVRDDIISGGTHSSETEQESFDADFNVVAKKGNLESVYHQLDSIMNHISAD